MVGNKRGAVELSITTIVVVVIGITLLTLGLIWVNNIFDRLGGTTEGAFEQVDTQIEEILGQGSGNWISVRPSTISLEKGEATTVKIILENVDRTTGSSYSLGATIVCTTGNNIDIKFVDGSIPNVNSGDYQLDSGFSATITAILKDTGAALGVTTCNFKIKNPRLLPLNTGADAPVTLRIDVKR